MVLSWYVGSLGLPQGPNRAWSHSLAPATLPEQAGGKAQKANKEQQLEMSPKHPLWAESRPEWKAPWWHGGAPEHGEPRDRGTKVLLAWCFSTSHLGPSSARQRNTSKSEGRVQQISGGEGPSLKALVWFVVQQVHKNDCSKQKERLTRERFTPENLGTAPGYVTSKKLDFFQYAEKLIRPLMSP